LKKKGEDTKALQDHVTKINKQISDIETKSDQALKGRDETRYAIGNILLPGVPIAESEEGDVVIREQGVRKEFNFPVRDHTKLVDLLNVAEIEKAAQVSGSRTFYLKNEFVFLNLALIQFALDFLVNERGFIPFWTPPFLRREVMEGASELDDFENTLYSDIKEDVFFIATSEQPLAALHTNELLDIDTLPRKYAGVSLCYRREAGSHGKDTKGYRVVNIASGELNANAAKKFDLEGWFPAQQKYRELCSCSNCTSYQSIKLNTQYGKAGGEKDYLHTLNSTAIASERTLCAIIENYQQEDGSVIIPKVLRPFINGLERIFPS
jgi:seryl-tRNA synthetase